MILFEFIIGLIALYVIYRVCRRYLTSEKESEKKSKVEAEIIRTKKLKEVEETKQELVKEKDELSTMKK